MRTSPSIVPRDQDAYLVRSGRVWTEADSETTDLESLLADMLAGQHRNPVRVIAFNVTEGWSRDVSEAVAQELRRRIDLNRLDVPPSLQDFLEQ